MMENPICNSGHSDYPLRLWDCPVCVAKKLALLEDVAKASRIIHEVTSTASTLRHAVACPHGNIPSYPAHALWCDYCWSDLEDALAKLKENMT